MDFEEYKKRCIKEDRVLHFWTIWEKVTRWPKRAYYRMRRCQ